MINILPSLNVYYLPQFVAESTLADCVVVVVDLLRASTTICQALYSRASCVVPCLEVDETFAKSQRYERCDVVLGGERGGTLIEGFDLGNSPADYTPDQVFGRTVLFTTTNGTKAIAHARFAERVLIGAAVNRQAVVDHLAAVERVAILCAGTAGNVTREDILASGAIVDRLLAQRSASEWQTNEWTNAAHREWQELVTGAHAAGKSISEHFGTELRDTQGGKNLLALGFDTDLEFCAELDRLNVVPEVDRQTGAIRLP